MRRLVVLISLATAVFGADPSVESLYRVFRDPPASYSVSPYWFWNGKITASETRRQVGEMVRQGVRSAVLMNWAGLEPPFLSEAWWKEVGTALDAARAAGLTLNFSDEFLWPSGQAWDYASTNPEPSRVLQMHPEYRMRRLTVRQFDAGAAILLDAEPEAVVAARVNGEGAVDEQSLRILPNGRRVDWKAPGPGWKIFAYLPVPAEDRGVRVDLLNPAAVRVFIDLVYEGFARRFPQHLSSTIRFFVSDHEGTYGGPLPFTPALWPAFRQQHGYDLRLVLPLLGQSTPRAAEVRRHYLDTVSRLYTAAFVQQVTDWCTAHGVQHGHSDIEETLLLQTVYTGDMFALWRATSAIYIDALVERARMPIDFQEALSVAHFEGRPLMVENQGLIGHDSYWSLEKARAGTNMCLLWGANRLVPHYFEYDPSHIQYPPSWFLTQPLWPWFHHYADLVRRAQYMNEQGRHRASVAIYAPVESALANSAGVFQETGRSLFRWNNSMDRTQDYYSALQLELARQGWEYHILDRHYLARADVAGSKLRLAGEESSVLILPPMTHIETASVERIRRFVAAGGVVAALGHQPAELDGIAMRRFPTGEHPLFMDRLSYVVRVQPSQGVLGDLAPVLRLLREVRPPEVEVVSGTRDGLYFSRRATSDAQWFWAVNDSAGARRITARFPGEGGFERWDAVTGERTALPSDGSTVALDFGPQDAFYVVRSRAFAPTPSVRPPTRRVLLELPSAGWRFTPESEIRVPYARVTGSAEPVWLAPERMANRNWWLAGPYPDVDRRGLYEPYPPERGFDANDPAWTWHESPTSAVRTAKRDAVYYAYVNVWSPAARRAQVAIAVANNGKLWWNGKLEWTARLRPPFVNLRDPWSYRIPVEVRQGWNTVLIKLGAAPAGANGFLFRLTDDAGKTLRDISYTRDRTEPRPSPSRRVRLTVDAPPGTRDRPVSYEVEENAIPERPIAFAPGTTTFTLASWTDSNLAHYSGSAIYEIDFKLASIPAGERIVLDLGAVGLAAEVWVNGSKAGERAWRPYELDVTAHVRQGTNRLRVRVANSNAGWMAQGDPIYERGAWGVKFASERDRLQTLRPNGLEGPVRLLSVTR
jgi:hypothetical protein